MVVFDTKSNRAAVIDLCCSVCGVKKKQFMTPNKKGEVVMARQLASKVFRDYMKLSYTEMGTIVSNRPKDHSTMIHSVKTVNNLLETNYEPVCKAWQTINERLPEMLETPLKLVISYSKDFEINSFLHLLDKKNLYYEFEA